MPKFFKLIKVILINLCVFVGLLFLLGISVEGYHQYDHRKSTGRWFFDNSRGYSVGFVTRVSDEREYSLRPNFSDGVIKIDALGFREMGVEQPTVGSEVIVTLGDSVPFGAEVRDSEAYPAQLDRMTTQCGVRVLNAGVPSYNLAQAVQRLYTDVLPHYRPRVIFVQVANDMSLFAQYGRGWTPELTWAEGRFSSQLPRGLTANSVMVSMVNSRLAYLKKEAEATLSLDAVHAQMIDHLAETIETLRMNESLRDVPIVILPIDPFYYSEEDDTERNVRLPNWERYKTTTVAWRGLVREINAQLARQADPKRSLYWFDTRPLLDKAGRAGRFVDWMHLSASGANVMANGLYDFLSGKQLITSCKEAAVVTAGRP